MREGAELGVCSFLAVDLLGGLGLEDGSCRRVDAVGITRARSGERDGWQTGRRRESSSVGLVLLNGGESLLSTSRLGATGEEVGNTVAF